MDWLIHVGFLTIIINIFTFQTVSSEVTVECKSANSSQVTDTRVLSRRKRYLVFPDGSSLQLVFCCQTAALIPIGDIFLYSSTAALAWNLPTDPDFLLMYKDKLRVGQRRKDLNEILYLDDNGKVLAKVPYKRKPIINPAFAKRSIEEHEMTFKEKLKLKINRRKMHELQESREYLNQKHMSQKSVKFHRRTRFGLYEKLEKLFDATGRDGRQCILYRLCESARRSNKQGTFLQELTRIVFTLPKDSDYDREEHKEYDQAHHHSNDECSGLYPGCDNIELS